MATDALDHVRDRIRIEEQRVVTAAGQDDDVAAWEDRALVGNDHRVGLGDDREMGNVVLVRTRAKASEHGAGSAKVRADQEAE